jgi:pimeloyl-ACP methyl ester carboxylesterase
VEKARIISDGIWFGVPISLNEEFKSQRLYKYQTEINNQHLILWGEHDTVIPKNSVVKMAEMIPNCDLKNIPNIGHSLNLENPALFAGFFIDFFS